MNTITNTLSPSATNMIRMDHAHVISTFHKYKIDSSAQTKQALVNNACLSLEIHAQLEEEIFYPAMSDVGADSAVLAKSVPEHDEMRRLIGELRDMEPTDPTYDQTFMELMRDVLHHVADEETTLLPDAERLLGDRLGEPRRRNCGQYSTWHACELDAGRRRGTDSRNIYRQACVRAPRVR
jgi:hemerythrin superfamily protein